MVIRKLQRALASRSNLPWACFGDFNEILAATEKEGGLPDLGSKLKIFKELLQIVTLMIWVGRGLNSHGAIIMVMSLGPE